MTALRRLRTSIGAPVCAVLTLDAFALWVAGGGSALSAIALVATAAAVLWLRREVALAERRRRSASSDRDPLTGLPDRQAFDEALGRELSRAPLRGAEVDDQTALVFVELDHFDAVSDLYGRRAGDQVLCSIAGVLGATLRPQDVLARMEGQRFAIVTSRTGDAGARKVVTRLEEALQSVVPAPGAEPLTAAIAYVLLGVDGEDAETLLHVADVRLQTGRDASLDSALAGLLG